MGQQRLNSLAVTAIHTDRLSAVDIDSLVERFCTKNEKRLYTFGSQ